MSMMDFGAMMGGAAPPDSALGDPAMGGPAPAEGGQSTVDILNQMLELAKLYIDTDEDEEDKLTMSKILSMLQGYLAAEQRESMDAMQGKLSPRMLAQSYGG